MVYALLIAGLKMQKRFDSPLRIGSIIYITIKLFNIQVDFGGK